MDQVIRGIIKQIESKCSLPILTTTQTTSKVNLTATEDTTSTIIKLSSMDFFEDYDITGMAIIHAITKEVRNIVSYDIVNPSEPSITIDTPFSTTVLENDEFLSTYSDHLLIRQMNSNVNNTVRDDYVRMLERYEIKLVVYDDIDKTKSTNYKRELMRALHSHSFPQVNESDEVLREMIYMKEKLNFNPTVDLRDVTMQHIGSFVVEILYVNC